MRDGFIKVAALSCGGYPADPAKNKDAILKGIEAAASEGAKIIALPELSLCGYTAGDALQQELLISACAEAVCEIARFSADIDALIIIGAPIYHEGRLLNAAVAINSGEVIGIVPKSSLTSSERRWFYEGQSELSWAESLYFEEDTAPVPLGAKLLFNCAAVSGLSVGIFFDRDFDAAKMLRARGASLLVNLSAMPATAGSAKENELIYKAQSLVLGCPLIRAAAGPNESVTDCVYDGQNIIAASEECFVSSKLISGEAVYFVLDTALYKTPVLNTNDNSTVGFYLDDTLTDITGSISSTPFLPDDKDRRAACLKEILSIQSTALLTRMRKIGLKKAVIGISGGLDSTLALICTAEAFKMAGWNSADIIAVTMPCFGTTDRTYENACLLAKAFGATLREIPIGDAVLLHFSDISHNKDNHNSAYENAQARERTQVLMDIANDCGGIVVGTGDMSELALGWATYNGDHMSMYGVNAGIPKTVVREAVAFYAENSEDTALKESLLDVVATPVSPELLPPEHGEIFQKTEEIVGPYELHDFFICHSLLNGFNPSKIIRMAVCAFKGKYTEEEIAKWLRFFYNRFYRQQFKRSCMPDGPQVLPVSLSPRGGLRLPSDADGNLWTDYIDNIYKV